MSRKMSNNTYKVNYKDLKIDKENEAVYYNDEIHKYWTKGSEQSCISVTTLIHKFTTFDEDFWSKYKAVQRLLGEDIFDGPIIGKQKVSGVTKDKRGPASLVKQALLDSKKYLPEYLEGYDITDDKVQEETNKILEEWEVKRTTSCIRGTAIHKKMEDGHLDGDTKELSMLKLGGSFKTDTSNKIKLGDRVIYPELLLSRISEDGKLRLAGQADLIIIDGFDVYILDYKTNQKIDTKSYFDSKLKKSQKLKYPLNSLDDCNFIHYSLQLSTYAWMLQKLDPRLNIKLLMLIHIDHDNNVTEYECDYLKADVERMLAFHKKQVEHEEFKRSRKKIIF